MGLLTSNGNLLTVGGKLATANAAPATPYMEAEYVEESILYGEREYITHKIKSPKLYNHTAIYANEFNGQTQLRNLDCSDPSNHITTIEYEAFQGALLGDIQFPATITALQPRCFADAMITTLVIPPLVSELPESTFSGISRAVNTQTGVEIPINIVLPSNLTEIGRRCFEGARIIQITIPDTVTEIGESAFYYCQALESFTIPPLLQKISDSMLSQCESITSIAIPASVTEIGAYAFSGMGITSITIPATVTTLGQYMLRGCVNLATINIQANVTEIPAYFAQESARTSVTLPDTVETIGDSAFTSSSAVLAEITIPASVTSIDDYAFAQNGSMTTITCLAATPPTLGKNVFTLTTGSVIKVPAASVAAYKAAAGWSVWADKIVGI